MARTTSSNFTGGLDFPVATAATDLFVKEDLQTVAQAVDLHDHSTGKGLAIATLPVSAIADGSITSAKIADGTIVAGDIADGAITSAKILDGTIATTDIAANAVQQVLGTYLASPTFSTTTTATWLATPILVNVTSLGGYLRIEGQVTIQHTAISGGALVAVHRGASPVATVGYASTPTGTNSPSSISFNLYDQPAAGVYQYVIYVFNTAAGTLSIYTGVSSALYVTEQKR